MADQIGLDVSLTETAISVRRDGQRIWGGECPSDPDRRGPPQACVRGHAGGVRDWSFIGVILS
jgi:hypothetical protein